MPLPQVTVQRLVITDFQGIDIERGKLVRAENSWEELTNFNLVKPGVIQKIRGNKIVTVRPIPDNDWIIALRDYQLNNALGPRIAAVSAKGHLFMGSLGDPIVLADIGPLFTGLPDELLDEAPFIISLPFMQNGEKVNYVVITVGAKDYPKKSNSLGITRLGISNPGDGFTVPYQHSLAAPQITYNNVGLGTDIYINTSPNPEQGIPVSSGRQYRAAWFNPITGHRSSLFPLHLEEWPIDYTYNSATKVYHLATKSRTKPMGIVQTFRQAPYVMAIPLFFDNLPDRNTFIDILPPQADYTHLQIFATRDGGENFYLVPVIYDQFGVVITDSDGAIPIESPVSAADDLKYGIWTPGSVFDPTVTPKMAQLYDGYVPIKAIVDNNGSPAGFEPVWTSPLAFDDVPNYIVNGAAQTGQILNVTRVDGPYIVRGQFILETATKAGPTVHSITAVHIVGGNDFQWIVYPPIEILEAPATGSNIQLLLTKPVDNAQLIDNFSDSTELPFDRINDPPPMASWGAVYQNRLFLLDANDKTSLVYSRIGDYESFPPENVFRFTQADFDPITAILAGRQVGLVSEGADQRLIVAKEQSTYQITGTSILDFALTGMFPETGVIHKRAAVVIGGFSVILSRQGIEVVQGQMPQFIGTKIKDIVDDLLLDEYGPSFAIERTNYQIIMGVRVPPSPISVPYPAIDRIILMREPRTGGEGFLSPFAEMEVPVQLGIIQESGFGKAARILAGGVDGNIWQLFTGGTSDGENALIAVAVSQDLPQLDRESRKIFRRIRFDGNDIGNDLGWKIAFSVDGSNYEDEVTMRTETLIGLVGKQLKFKIRHVRAVDDIEDPPKLSNIMVEYSVIGESRGGQNA